jgi:site-specific DNA-methyltransferase (adenine-specific)
MTIPQNEDWLNSIIQGDAKTILQTLPDFSINCIITSPPYYMQRDYEASTQIGNEKSPVEYLQNLRVVFTECYRVLKEDGTLWLNLGDKYQDGNLLGIPWQVAFSLKEEGWILRSDIIWYKPNAMPASVKNRPTTDHEYLFLFTKSNDYYYDIDAIREPHTTFTSKSRMKGGRNHFGTVTAKPTYSS